MVLKCSCIGIGRVNGELTFNKTWKQAAALRLLTQILCLGGVSEDQQNGKSLSPSSSIKYALLRAVVSS